MYNFCFSGNPIFENKKGADEPTKAEVKNMSKKGKIRVALGSLLALTLVVTCVAVYQSGSKSRANEKEFVKENEEDIVDQAIKTEEREETEEETQDVNTTDVEGTREVEDSTPESTEETVMHVFIASAGVFVTCMFPIHQFLYLFSTSHGLFSIPLRHTQNLSLPKTSSGKCSNRTGCSLPS